MSKPFDPKIVSANDLFEGHVIYLNRAGGWTRRLDLAAIAENENDAEALFKAANQPLTVVDPHLVEVSIEADGTVLPAHIRQRLRTNGPSATSVPKHLVRDLSDKTNHSNAGVI